MMRRTLLTVTLIVFMITIIAGCGNDRSNDPVYPPEDNRFTLTATIPLDNTIHFPRSGKVIFHFNREIDTESIRNAVNFVQIEDDGSESVIQKTISAVGDNVYVNPKYELPSSSRFKVTLLDSIKSISDEPFVNDANRQSIEFTTGQNRAIATVRPVVVAVTPDLSSDFIPDTSTFRIFFSEPLNESTLKYGGHVKLLKDEDENVPAMMFVYDDMIVVDPDIDLDPDASYSLSITGIADRNGETLEGNYTRNFVVTGTYIEQDSEDASNKNARRNMVPMILCPTLGTYSTDECSKSTDPANLPPSPFTGDLTNTITFKSQLLGYGTFYVSGKLAFEIGNSTINSNFLPIVIRKGQRLYATSIETKLGGQIQTGYKTGDIVFTLVSDASGLIAGSEYVYGIEGKRAAFITSMDLAINTESSDPSTNSMFSQPILGIDFVGETVVRNNKLTVEFTGFSEMKIQGETIPLNFSFSLISSNNEIDENNEDTTPPRLRVTTPALNDRRAHLTHQIVGYYDEPIDPKSAIDYFSLQSAAGAEISGVVKTLGSKVVFTSNSYLSPNTDYKIVIAPGISDISGNETTSTEYYNFRTGADEASDSLDFPPLLTATQPGPYEFTNLPANFPLIVCFNQSMDFNTIRLGETFNVYDMNDSFASVRGTIYSQGSYFIFEPNEYWIPGHSYRMVITKEMTNLYGVPLNFDTFETENPLELSIDFKAIKPTEWVMLHMMLDPIVDTNGSGFVDGNETGNDDNKLKMHFPIFKEFSYLAGHLIFWVKGILYDDYGVPYMSVDLMDGTFLTSTSVRADIFSKGGSQKGLFDPIGMMFFDQTEISSANIVQASSQEARMNLKMSMKFNMSDDTFDEILDNYLEFNPKGYLSLSKDGKIVSDITGSFYIRGDFDIPLIDWDLPIVFPATFNWRAVTAPLPYN